MNKQNKLIDNSIVVPRGERGGRSIKKLKGVKYIVMEGDWIDTEW